MSYPNYPNCRKSVYPPFAPKIISLSSNRSVSGVSKTVYIYGANFLPAAYGTTYVNFGTITNIPIVFYSSSMISFMVPLNEEEGTYKIAVVNVYNGNFGSSISCSTAGNLNYSNEVNYYLYEPL